LTELTFADFVSNAFNQEPFPILERLRTTQPLVPFKLPNGAQAWMVVRYEDALTILKDPRLSKDIRTVLSPQTLQQSLPNQEAREAFGILSRHMLTTNPPDHTRLRMPSRTVWCAVEHGLISPMQSGRIWKEILGSSCLPEVERQRGK
jgi:cytochrome P450